MEVLAKAAVAEICKLVDDGYAVLRLEISRSEKENQTLKRKLQMLEVMVARGYADVGLKESTPSSRPDGVQVCEELREGHFPNTERTFGNQLSCNLWRAREPTTADEPHTATHSVTRDKTMPLTIDHCLSQQHQSADVEEGQPESQPIKEETLEWDLENSAPQGGLKISEERAAELDPDDGERISIVDTQTAPAIVTEELPHQHKTRHSGWEDSELDTVLKSEPANESVNPQDTDSELSAQKLNIMSYEEIMQEGSCQQEFFITQEVTEKDVENPACSRTAESESENLSVQSEILSGKSLSSLGSLDVKREDIMTESDLMKVEAEMRSTWNKEIMSGLDPSQHSYYNKDWEGEGLQLESDTDACPSHSEMTFGDSTAEIRFNASSMNGWTSYDKRLTEPRTVATPCTATSSHDDPREECFICTQCGKTFTCQKVFEAHQRIHTLDKPFNCQQCGKRFAQLSNLITHRRVHTGEKPYSCTHCGKQFAQSRYLVTHLRIHTGEKPFSCTQCGKRFAQSNNLVRHQSVHTGKKPFRCSQCGKSFTTSSHRKRHESVHRGGRPFVCAL